CGKGVDVAGLDDAARAGLRRQALDWLRAGLAVHARRLASGQNTDRERVRNTMRNRQRDKDLAGVRDADALAKLPEAERADWKKYWADVDKLLKQGEAAK